MTSVPPASPAGERTRAPARFWTAALLLVVLFGAALRIIKLGAESLWLDEAYSIQVAHRPLGDMVREVSKDVHPPLYYFALHCWIQLFGDSESSARLLSVIFGILAIPLLYKVCSLLFDRATALLSAIILAWSHLNIEFSQEARMYSLVCLLSLASFYFFLGLLKSKAGPRTLIWYITCSALLAYTHVYGWFIIAAEAFYVLLLAVTSRQAFRRVFRPWLFAQAIILLLYSPWLFVFAQQVREHTSFWIPRPTLVEFGYTWLRFAGTVPLLVILVPLAALPIISLATGRLGFFLRGPEDGHSGLPLANSEGVCFVVLWLASPFLLPFIASYFVRPIYLAKYAIPASLAFIALAARGLALLRGTRARAVVLIVFLILAQRDIVAYWKTVKKDQWREAVVFFNQSARSNDLVLFREASGAIPFDYYAKRGDITERPLPEYDATGGNVAEVLKPAVEGHGRVWIVLSHQDDSSPLALKQMSEWYGMVAHRNVPGIEMYLFKKK